MTKRTKQLPLNPDNAPVGTRMLINRSVGSESPVEVEVLEWSPSSTRVKLYYATMASRDHHIWLSEYDTEWHNILEILPPKSVESSTPYVHPVKIPT